MFEDFYFKVKEIKDIKKCERRFDDFKHTEKIDL